MLSGEQTSYISVIGTLYLVPMTDGGAKALPKNLRKLGRDATHDGGTTASTSPDVFNSELLREHTITPIQCTSTNYRLFVKPVTSSVEQHAPTLGGHGEDSARLKKEIAVPYMLVDRYEIDIREPKIFALTVFTKWTWVLRIQSVHEEPIQSLANVLQQNFPKSVHQFFAFTYFGAVTRAMAEESDDGASMGGLNNCGHQDGIPLSLRDGDGVYDTSWGALNLERELHRQTVLNGTPFEKGLIPMALPQAGDPDLQYYGCGRNLLPWFHVVKLSRMDIFASYPLMVIAPRKVSEELLNKCASYRHAGRVPVVTWIHGINGATLARSAQPKAGSRKPAKDDQTLCSHLNQSYHATNAAPSSSLVAPALPMAHHEDPFMCAPHRSKSPPPPIPADSSRKKPPSLFERNSSSSSLDEGDQKANHAAPTTAAPNILAPSQPHPAANDEAPPMANKSELRSLHIVDCRSRTAATANMATGGGFENVRNYDRATIEFMGLDNIHVVRDSFEKLRKLCVAMQHPQVDGPTTRSVHGSFHSRLESTGWVELQQRLMWASWKTATLLHSGSSVLVHCTDGWDRTAQVVSLAKIQLDPHYRTIEGFCELVMLEWLEMGHKFADRCGMQRAAPAEENEDAFVRVASDGEEESDNDEQQTAANIHSPRGGNAPHGFDESTKGGGGTSAQPSTATNGAIAAFFASPKRNKSHSPSSQLSPIFLQFIDCVYQLLQMFPVAFEFTPAFLEMILEAAYSCQFGTFLYNTHRMRTRKNGLISKTMSLWGAVEHRLNMERLRNATPMSDGIKVLPEERLLNLFFNPLPSRCAPGSSLSDVANAFTKQRLIPSFHSYRYRFWTSFYARYMWEGTGCPTEAESAHPLLDAVLVLAEKQRAIESQLQSRDLLLRDQTPGQQEGLGLTSFLAGWFVSNGRREESDDVMSASSKRVLFLHRVPQSHLTSDWQVISRSASDTPGVDSEGGRPLLLAPSCETNACSPLTGTNVILFKTRDDKSYCQLCAAEFTMFFRRHTCRRCCRTACGKCADNFFHMPPNSIALFEDRDATHPVRLCNICAAEMRKTPWGAPNRGVPQASSI